jgi:redox-sensing transcriptional repressor
MKKLSKKTISRALLYIRTLENLIKEKKYFVSSQELSSITGISDSKIRKDIACFGKVGKPRIGYDTRKLKRLFEDFLLHKKVIHIVIFGVGNLGTAIVKYFGIRRGKLKIVAAFDKDKKKIGTTIKGIRIYPVAHAAEIIAKYHGDIGIIAVPEKYSQEVADIMVAAHLKGIVNFTPTSINVAKDVFVKDIDFSISFLALYCNSRT